MEIIVNRDTDEEIAYFEDRDGDQVQIVATKERTLSMSGGMTLNRYLAAKLWPFIMRFAETGKLSESMTEQIGAAFSRQEAPASKENYCPLQEIAADWIRKSKAADETERGLQKAHHDVGLASDALSTFFRDILKQKPLVLTVDGALYLVTFNMGTLMYEEAISPERVQV